MGSSLIIVSGGGTDTSEGNPNINPSVVLTGYTIYDIEGEKLTGDMAAQSTSASNLNPGDQINIPFGYHDGTHAVSAVVLSSKTSATADAGHILNAYTGWKNGNLITGSMANKGTTNGSISANGTYTVPVGWHNGNGKVTQSLSTQGATTVTPGTSNKTVIAASKWSTGNQIVAGNGNLTAGNIKKNVSIFGVTGSYQLTKQAEVWLMNGWTLWSEANGVGIFRNDLEKSTWKYRQSDRFSDKTTLVTKECWKFETNGRQNKNLNFGFWYYGNYTKLEIVANTDNRYSEMWAWIEQYGGTTINDSQRLNQTQIYNWMTTDSFKGTFNLPSYNGGQMFISVRTYGGSGIAGDTYMRCHYLTMRMY